MNNNYYYLKNEIAKIIAQPKHYRYWYLYNLAKIKHFFLQTIIVFSLQYMIIFNYITSISFSYPTLPMYPPIGIAFVMFSIFGNNAFIGLLLSDLIGYLITDLPMLSILLYLIADIGAGYLAAYLCQSIFSTDVRILLHKQEIIKFISINATIICLASSAIRITTIIFSHKINLKPNAMFYMYINLWLTDLNAILILASFLLTWIYVPLSREKITNKQINKFNILLLMAFIITCVLYMNHPALICLIIIAMIISIRLTWVYGHLIGTALLFIISSIYLTYFIGLQQQYLSHFGLAIYTLVPTILLLFIISILYIGHLSIRNNGF